MPYAEDYRCSWWRIGALMALVVAFVAALFLTACGQACTLDAYLAVPATPSQPLSPPASTEAPSRGGSFA